MWNSDSFMVADEVVADGAQCHRRPVFPHQTTLEELTELSSKHQDSSKLNSDSGFLSGVSITEDSSVITTSSISLTEEQDSMKLKSAPQFSGCRSKLGYSSAKENNLSGSNQINKPQNGPQRRITLHDLLRQDEDGDT